jgi:phosphatidylglycerophosphate synthase
MMVRFGTWAKFWLVQAITVGRIVGALVFICVAFIPELRGVAAAAFSYCVLSDLIDGYVARRLKVATSFGQVLDLLGDKYLTIVSCVYAIHDGIWLLPCAFIILREVLSLSLRTLAAAGQAPLRSSRLIGGLVSGSLWLATFLLLIDYPIADPAFARVVFSVVAVFYLVYFPYQLAFGYRALKIIVQRELE